MNNTETPERLDEAIADSSQYNRREKLLASLLSEDDSLLLDHTPRSALLRLANGNEVLLLTCDQALLLPDLKKLVSAAVKEKKSGVLQVVVVTDADTKESKTIRRLLKSCAPTLQFSRQFGFYNLLQDNKLTYLVGTKAPALERAAGSMDSATILEPELIRAQLEANGAELAADRAHAAALSERKVWVTWALAATCVGLFALEKLWGSDNFTSTLWRMGANSSDGVRGGEVWRLLASNFLHGSVGHLIANLFALAIFGPILERVLGARRYLLLYGLSGLAGSIASVWIGSVPLSVGSSGAIWGLMTAGVVLALRPQDLLPKSSLSFSRRQVVLPLVINFFYSFSEGIDLYAHFGGGIAGFLLFFSGAATFGIVAATQSKPTAHAPVLSAAAALMATLMIASIATSLLIGKPWSQSSPGELVVTQVADTKVSLPLPALIADKLIVIDQGALRIYTFGTLNTSPVVVELLVNHLSTPVEPADLHLAIANQRLAAESSNPPQAVRLGDVKEIEVKGYPFLLIDHRMGKVRLRSWTTVGGEIELVLRVYTAPGVSASWNKLGEAIVEGLEHSALVPLPVVSEVEAVAPEFWAGCKHEISAGQVQFSCGDDLAIEYGQVPVKNARFAATRRAVSDYMINTWKGSGLSPAEATPIAVAMALPYTHAVWTTVSYTNDEVVHSGKGMVAAHSPTAGSMTIVTCYDYRAAESQPSCLRLVSHLVAHGLPEGVSVGAAPTAVTFAGRELAIPDSCTTNQGGNLQCGDISVLWEHREGDEPFVILPATLSTLEKARPGMLEVSEHPCLLDGVATTCSLHYLPPIQIGAQAIYLVSAQAEIRGHQVEAFCNWPGPSRKPDEAFTLREGCKAVFALAE